MYYQFIASSTQRQVMRITITQGSLHRCIGYFLLLLLLCSLCLPGLNALSPQPLIIEVYDTETSNALQTDTVFQLKSYDIAIGTAEDIGFVVNVTITVPWNVSITTNATPFITIQAPPWDNFRTFVINASKVGYQSAERTLTVMKGALSLRTDHSAVKETEEFQVTIRDQDNQPVEGALVFFDPDGTYSSTDAQGIAYLTAPTVAYDKSLVVKTLKEGYVNSSASVLIEHVATIPVLGDIALIQVIPILFAAVAVIFAVFYVRWRKRMHRDLPPTPSEHAPSRELAREGSPNLEKREWDISASSRTERRVTSLSSSDSKIEEIRIPLQEKKKETTILSAEVPPEPSHSRQNKEEDEWFKGEEYMRYKLDEMTGTIDRKNEGKWFEGERDIQSKVDEALKKQSKKKKANQDIK